MDTMNNKTDRYFRDRLDDFEQSPPAAAWDHIVRKLEGRKKKKTLMIFFRIAAGMAVLISTGIGVYLISRGEDNQLPAQETVAEDLAPGSKPDLAANELSQTLIDTINSHAHNALNSNQASNPEILNNLPEISNRLPNEQPVNVALPEITDELENGYLSENELARVDHIAPTITFADTNFIKLQMPGQVSDTGMTPAQITDLLLAQYNNEDANEAEKSRDHNWTIGSEVAPLYSDRSINASNIATDELNSGESGILAFAGGFRVAMNAGKRLSVQSGIYYSRSGQEINQVGTIPITNNQTDNVKYIAASNSTGTISGVVDTKKQNNESLADEYYVINHSDYRNGIEYSKVTPVITDNPDNIILRQYFDYFEVPLILKYKIIDRKLDFSFSGGVVTNFLVGNSVTMVDGGESTPIGKTSDISEINYLGSIGIGLEYPVVDRFSFTFEPRFRYYINQINQASDISVHPYSFGFFAGINYKF
jgi:hypothetical protein